MHSSSAHYKSYLFYMEQRAAWMLRLPMPTEHRIGMYRQMDRNLNPHNDSYKPKLRSDAEIIADLLREQTDEALTQIYGRDYSIFVKDWNNSSMTVGRLYKSVEDNDAGN